MKKLIVLVALVAAIAGTASGTAEAGRWIPGTPWMVSESDMQDLLEQTYDWAYCSGIPRFGTQGEFPYEEFIVFECSTKLNGSYCSDYRVRSVKGKQRGWFQLRWVKGYGDCW